jgi:hypothetical protein
VAREQRPGDLQKLGAPLLGRQPCALFHSDPLSTGSVAVRTTQVTAR